MWKPDVCLYHFPCDDGFASAWVVRHKWPDVIMAPTNYGLPMPDVELAGKNVLIADFSYPYDQLTAMADDAASIVILDHHKTAAEDLRHVRDFPVHNAKGAQAEFGVLASAAKIAEASAPNVVVGANALGEAPLNVLAVFDMERSGAGITWDFCFPDEMRPRLIDHIQDRDLWRFKLDHTRALSLLIRSYPYDFEVWDDLMRAFDDIGGDRANVLAEAHAIERYYDRRIAELVETATIKKFGKWPGVPVVHAPYAFASDVANALLDEYQDAPFAAAIVDAYGGRSYSLRSNDDRQDVSEVAKAFGGGGHRNAAGFRMPV